MPAASLATTSRFTTPSTIRQISSTSSRNGRFSLAASVGFVVTPSSSPMAATSCNSWTLAVSRKIFICTSPSRGFCALERAVVLARTMHSQGPLRKAQPLHRRSSGRRAVASRAARLDDPWLVEEVRHGADEPEPDGGAVDAQGVLLRSGHRGLVIQRRPNGLHDVPPGAEKLGDDERLPERDEWRCHVDAG